MTFKINKHQLKNTLGIQTLKMAGKPISVVFKDNNLFVYSLIDDNISNIINSFDFIIMGTGYVVNWDLDNFTFLGSVQTKLNTLHVFCFLRNYE